ncbi:MAG: hypothetical protein ABFS12_03370 [Bacteroidota bacterium]
MKNVSVVISISFLVFITLSCKESTEPEQPANPWTTYTISDGLPYNSIGAIAFEPDGDLWCVPLVSDIGGGVVHYDGKTWEQYTTQEGLATNMILWYENAVTLSSDGIVWIATFGGGVSKYDGQTWTTYTTEDGLLSNLVAAVAVGPNGDLWCAHPVPEGGISHFDGNNWTVYTPSDLGVSFCSFTSLAFDQNGTLWAGGGVVVSFDGSTWTSFSSETWMEQPIALYMDISQDGKIWITGNGVSSYDGTTWKFYSFEEIGIVSNQERIIPLAVDTDNILWVGYMGNGVFRFDGNAWSKFTTENGPNLSNVISISIAPDGALWFGTENGIHRYQP